jgi:hypothetical protein
VHKHTLAQKEAAAKAQGASEEALAAELAPSPDDPLPLTAEELAGARAPCPPPPPCSPLSCGHALS